MDKKPGWQYLECVCENFTQAENLDLRLRTEGWLFTRVFFAIDSYILNYKRRIWHTPGWYVSIVNDSAYEDEYGPFNNRLEAEKSINLGETSLSVKCYGLNGEIYTEVVDRFETIGKRI